VVSEKIFTGRNRELKLKLLWKKEMHFKKQIII
jgi:hypothetical protein